MSYRSKNIRPKPKARPKRKAPKPRRTSDSIAPASLHSVRLEMERMFRSLARGGEETEDDIRRDRAAELAMMARSAPDYRSAIAALHEAIELDPDCVDAHIQLSQLKFPDMAARRAEVERIVARERSRLGEEYFRENAGHFWGIMETRPYMRAHAYLAQICLETGLVGDAARHYETLIELCPNDNMGVRDTLVTCYVRLGEFDKCEELIRRYIFDDSEEDDGEPSDDDDSMLYWNCAFLWSWILIRFMKGDEPGAEAALKQAVKANPFVALYLLGNRKLPLEKPDSYQLGTPEEAVIAAEDLIPAWKQYPKAIVWLKRVLARRN
jgi:tetratricopeptide (TPR) repeat protein